MSLSVMTSVVKPHTDPGPRMVAAAVGERQSTQSSPASAMSPAVALPLRFIVTGVLALGLGLAVVLVRPDVLATYHYNQYTVAVTHLLVLGFMLSIAMGAMYQLVPVALEVRLHSQRMASWQYLWHLVGFAGMTAMFWRWDLKQVGHFASVLALGVGLFIYNIGRTLRRVPRWTVVATGITSALAWLGGTVLVGLVMAAAKCTYGPAAATGVRAWFGPLLSLLEGTATWVQQFDALAVMHAHAHLGVIGFFLMLMVGVSYKLIPMFLLTDLQSERRARGAIWLMNGGLAGLFVTMAVRHPLRLFFAGVVIAGLAMYGAEVRAMVRARRRRRLDWGLVQFLTAIGLLAPVAVLGLVLAWPGLPATLLTTQLETVYGFLAVAGVIAWGMLGFLYKIVPFLVWYHVYSRQVGRAKVPSLADLYSERLQVISYGLHLAGLGVTSWAAAAGQALGVRFGCGLLVAGLAMLAVNLGLILRHLCRPALNPIVKVNA